jgi:pSer/pThr/pTyr-binding forkhead associated (FHA) protein
MIMANTNRKLLTVIQELNQLLSEDTNQPLSFQEAAQVLARATGALDSEKRHVCIISSELELAQSFHDRLSTHQTLEKDYQFQLQRLPLQLSQAQEPVSSAFLVFQRLAEDGEETQEVRYELSSKPILEVGRKPGCDINVPDYCTRVSGRHLEVYICSAENFYAPPQWGVQNAAECKNGTFINGEPLVGRHLLQAGDRLTLGDRYFTPKSPTLLFESLPKSDEFASDTGCIDHCKHQSLENLVSCDILLLVIDSQRELLEEEKKLLKAAKAITTLEAFLVIPLKETTEIINIFQQPHSPMTVEDLSQAMACIDYKQISAIKTKRALNQVLSTIDHIEQVILTEQEKIKREMQTVEHQHSQASKQDSTTDIAFLTKVINEQKTSYVKAIESSLNDAKHDLLDDSLADSIQQKIQDLIDGLEAHVVKQGDKKYLELKAQGSEANVNDFIVEFCEEELLAWANEEWRKIRQCYAYDGLEGLARNSSVSLKPTYEKVSTVFEFRVRQRIEIEGVFQSSLKRISCRIDYQEDPIFIYFIKKIRSSVFQVMGILFLLSFLGVSRGSFMRSIVSRITSSPFLSLLALVMLVWLLYKLYKTYQNDRAAEVRKASEKIRQELRNYYQKLVKNRFAEKLTQSLEASLKEEVSRFNENIKAFADTISKKPTETENGQMDLRAYLKECQSKIVKLERKMKDFQKMKDKLQRLENL